MFKKWKTTHHIRGQRRIKVTDWDAVFRAIFVGAIGIGILILIFI